MKPFYGIKQAALFESLRTHHSQRLFSILAVFNDHLINPYQFFQFNIH